jgi:general nucleoside transport system ATP-binding protein
MSNLLPTGKPRIDEMKMVGIVKRFPGVLANDHVDFDVKAGEIHALLGENGAGKSTLVRQLYGLYRPDEGQILINGQPHTFHSPQDAISAGIGMIHQHFMLVPSLTVVENVALGLKSSRGMLLDLDRVEKRIIDLCKQYGLKVNPRAYVWQLAVGEQQRVEILKALYRGAALMVLDEPTAVLTPQEVDDLFGTFRQMSQDGHGLIFISHKLHEVLAISHRVTVLRDGQVVGECKTSGVTKTELAQMMVGRPIILQYEVPPPVKGETRLEIQDLHVAGDQGSEALKGVIFGSPFWRDPRPGWRVRQRAKGAGGSLGRTAPCETRQRGLGRQRCDTRLAFGPHCSRAVLYSGRAYARRGHQRF